MCDAACAVVALTFFRQILGYDDDDNITHLRIQNSWAEFFCCFFGTLFLTYSRGHSECDDVW